MLNTATANPVLSGIFNKFMRDEAGFVAEVLAPTFNTALQSAQYYVFDKENFLLIPTNIERAPGAIHKRVGMKVSDDNYFCKNYGIAMPVPDEDRQRYSIALNADTAAIKRITDILKVNRELRVKTLVTNTAAVANASPAIKWNDSGCNPRTDVDAGKESVRKGCGHRVNTMVISETVRLNLSQNAEVRKAFQLAIGGVLTMEMLKAYFEIPNIVVAGTVLATSAEGAATTADDIWTDDVVLAHVEPSQDLMAMNLARTFNWTGVGSIDAPVKSWRDDDAVSDIHQADHATAEKIVAAPCGYLLTDVLA
ncbi:MAG TPA: hypothetical protein VK530_17755 [Candidatus Acidoferrum sp.]|nr:hypothetical protein [Candidatus Acidoferrum sp.]